MTTLEIIIVLMLVIGIIAVYFENKHKPETPVNIKENMINCAGVQHFNPKELIYGETEIIGERIIPKEKEKKFYKKAEKVNQFIPFDKRKLK